MDTQTPVSLAANQNFVLEMDLPLKGKRHYLHFPDVYEALCRHLSDIHVSAPLSDLTMAFRMELHRRPVFLYGPANAFDAGDRTPSFQIELTVEGQRWKGCLVETDSRELERVADTQHVIAPSVRIEGERVTLASASGESAMEELITMAKEYMKTRFTERTQFRFVKMELSRPIQSGDEGRIRLEFQPRSRRAFLKTIISVGDEVLGYGLGAALEA